MGLLLQFGFYIFLFIGTIVYCIHMFVDGLVNDYKKKQEDEKACYEANNGTAWEEKLLLDMRFENIPLTLLESTLESEHNKHYHTTRMPIDDEAEEFIRNWKPRENYVELYGEEMLKKQLQVQAKYIAKYNKEHGL